MVLSLLLLLLLTPLTTTAGTGYPNHAITVPGDAGTRTTPHAPSEQI
jgi:hypothetical protein